MNKTTTTEVAGETVTEKRKEVYKIKGTLRTETGKSANRKLRNTGKIPANILVKGKSTMIDLEAKLLNNVWKSGKEFLLDMNGELKKVRIHELQINAIKRTPVHVDLMYV